MRWYSIRLKTALSHLPVTFCSVPSTDTTSITDQSHLKSSMVMLKFNRIVVSPVCSFLSIINSFVSFVVINSVVSYRNNTTILINAIRLKYDPRFVPSRISIGTFLKHFCNNNNDNNNNNLYDYDHECGVCVCAIAIACFLSFWNTVQLNKQLTNNVLVHIQTGYHRSSPTSPRHHLCFLLLK